MKVFRDGYIARSLGDVIHAIKDGRAAVSNLRVSIEFVNVSDAPDQLVRIQLLTGGSVVKWLENGDQCFDVVADSACVIGEDVAEFRRFEAAEFDFLHQVNEEEF
jgi:hypothetical protein